MPWDVIIGCFALLLVFSPIIFFIYAIFSNPKSDYRTSSSQNGKTLSSSGTLFSNTAQSINTNEFSYSINQAKKYINAQKSKYEEILLSKKDVNDSNKYRKLKHEKTLSIDEIFQMLNNLDKKLLLNVLKNELEYRTNSFDKFEEYVVSDEFISQDGNIEILLLLYITIERCNIYHDFVQNFIDIYYYTLGPKISVLLSTHFLATSLKNRYIAHESDLRWLLYLLQYDEPIYSDEALSFDKELESHSALHDRYRSDIDDYNAKIQLIKKYRPLMNVLEDNVLYRDDTLLQIALAKDGLSLSKLKQIINSLETKRTKIKDVQKKFEKVNNVIDGIKNEINGWLESTKDTIKIVDEHESTILSYILNNKTNWIQSNSKIFENCVNFLNENFMLYEQSCFCANITDAFKGIVFPRKIKSIIIRTHANFLKSVYKKSIQKIGDIDNPEFKVQGPTYLTLQNNIHNCSLNFLVVGPTVEQIILDPSKNKHDLTSIEIKPGWYTIVCEPRNIEINPLILEGNCVPGKKYPISVIVNENIDSEFKKFTPSTIGSGYSVDVGLFGAININPHFPLYLSYNSSIYHIGTYLGEGSGGIVYQATNTETGEISAFKFMTTDVLGYFTQIEIGIKEWKNYQDLTYKKNIVNIQSYSNDLNFYQQNEILTKKKEVVAYKMEYACNGSLRNFIDKMIDNDLQLINIIKILREISIGLESIHNSGLIHRDIRPENILVFETSPQYRICDFTLTRNKADLITEQLTTILGKKGSFSFVDEFDDRRTVSTLQSLQKIISSSTFYASPEEHEGLGNLDERSDLYSLGGIFYWLLVGFDPFEIELREFDLNLYERYRMAIDCKVINLDSKRREELFGELVDLRENLRNVNLRMKKKIKMNASYELIEYSDISESSFKIINDFLSKTLHPNPNQRFNTTSEVLSVLEEMEATLINSKVYS